MSEARIPDDTFRNMLETSLEHAKTAVDYFMNTYGCESSLTKDMAFIYATLHLAVLKQQVADMPHSGE